MNTKPEHKEIVKKTVFEELDTVNKLKPQQIDGLIKLEALFSPSFAFSDTQLIDNKGLRDLYFQKPSKITKNIFEEDSVSDTIGSTIEVCYRPKAKRGEEIDFRKVIENMIEKSKEPMLFSSLKPSSNEKLKKMRARHGKVTYNEFIEILQNTEPTEAGIFNSYIEWLNGIFNKKNHCSKKEWNFQNYSELVTNVIEEKKELEKYYNKLKTPSATNFHSWLKDKLEEKPDRTPLIKELQRKFKLREIKKPDKEIYEQILNFPYNYNLAKSHNYAFTQESRSKDLTELFYNAGLLGSKQLEKAKREQIEEFYRRYKRPRLLSINRRINLNKTNYDHIQMIRTSTEFRDLLINGFLNNDDLIMGHKAFEEYCKYIYSKLPKEESIIDEIPQIIAGGTITILGGIQNLNAVGIIIISCGVCMLVTNLFRTIKRNNQTDRDIGRI